MKLTETEILRGLALAVAFVTGSLYAYDTNKTNTETQIFADKIITLNKIHNQYELSNVTGYANCIKMNSESACLKRMESISKHFANEYNSKLLKIVSAEYGIDTIENKASGRLTAIGKIKSTLDFGVLFDYNNSTKDEYSIYFNKFDSRMPTLAEAYGMNEMKKGEDLLLLSSFNKVVNKDIQDIVENKDEVVSIGSKFAELGLKAQNENSKELKDIKDLLDLVIAKKENPLPHLRD